MPGQIETLYQNAPKVQIDGSKLFAIPSQNPRHQGVKMSMSKFLDKYRKVLRRPDSWSTAFFDVVV